MDPGAIRFQRVLYGGGEYSPPPYSPTHQEKDYGIVSATEVAYMKRSAVRREWATRSDGAMSSNVFPRWLREERLREEHAKRTDSVDLSFLATGGSSNSLPNLFKEEPSYRQIKRTHSMAFSDPEPEVKIYARTKRPKEAVPPAKFIEDTPDWMKSLKAKKTSASVIPPLKSKFTRVTATDSRYTHGKIWHEQAYSWENGITVPKDPMNLHFLRNEFDGGNPCGAFCSMAQRHSEPSLRATPLIYIRSTVEADKFVCVRTKWTQSDAHSMRSWIENSSASRISCSAPRGGIQVWKAFRTSVRTLQHSDNVIALASAFGLVCDHDRCEEHISSLQFFPLLTWFLLAILTTNGGPSYYSTWIEYHRLMISYIDNDALAVDLIFLCTLNAYLPFMSNELRQLVENNGLLDIQYRGDTGYAKRP
jgi:hypothetical protein